MTWNTFDENTSFDGTPRLSGTSRISTYIKNSQLYKSLQQMQQTDIYKIFNMLSDNNVKKHTQTVITTKQRSIRHLVLYIDASPWLYNFKMNSAAILSEWNYLCQQYNPDLACGQIDFKLSRIARKKGETGVVIETGSVVSKPKRNLTQDEANYIKTTTKVIQNQRLREQVSQTMIKSLTQSD